MELYSVLLKGEMNTFYYLNLLDEGMHGLLLKRLLG